MTPPHTKLQAVTAAKVGQPGADGGSDPESGPHLDPESIDVTSDFFEDSLVCVDLQVRLFWRDSRYPAKRMA
jgi:hypothetical protein